MSDTHTPEDVQARVRSTAEDALRLLRILDDAAAVQWQASPVPRPREDTTQRAAGTISNPTLDVVTDERRLAVREAVQRASKALDALGVTLRGARREVEDALSAWEGSTD